MTLTDMKGKLLARQGNLTAGVRRLSQQVVLIESDLAQARRAEALAMGELQETEQILAEIGQTEAAAPAAAK